MEVFAIRLSQRHFGVLCLLGYVVLSWAVRFDMRLGAQIASLVYPLDTFSMYAGMPGADTSHLLVRDREGVVHRVEDFQAFECAQPLAGPAAACQGTRGIPYHYEDMTRYIARHPGRGDEEVELITRTWEFSPGAPSRTSDCVISRCTVAR